MACLCASCPGGSWAWVMPALAMVMVPSVFWVMVMGGQAVISRPRFGCVRTFYVVRRRERT